MPRIKEVNQPFVITDCRKWPCPQSVPPAKEGYLCKPGAKGAGSSTWTCVNNQWKKGIHKVHEVITDETWKEAKMVHNC